MSARDEMNAIILEAWSLGVGVDVLADALMPVVERVAKEALTEYERANRASIERNLPWPKHDDILRRVCGG